jgi:putative aldouronate transport system permease protein
MHGQPQASARKPSSAVRFALKRIYYDRQLYVLLLPGIVIIFLFRYLPMGGLVIAFQDFNIFKGIWKSPWVGLANFREVFLHPDFWSIFRNTVLISVYKLVAGFPVPIVLALMLDEMPGAVFKRTVQTIIYLPHFISWVVLAGILLTLFSPSGGVLNQLAELFGTGPVTTSIMTQSSTFRGVLVVSNIWKECGWGTIIYLAAISTIDPNLFEAAKVDGAGRFRQIWHITLPCIGGVIAVLLILAVGNLMEAGFEQILVMQNDIVRNVSEIFDTYVYTRGIAGGRYSFTATVGMFKSVVSLVLIYGANKVVKLLGEEGLI